MKKYDFLKFILVFIFILSTIKTYTYNRTGIITCKFDSAGNILWEKYGYGYMGGVFVHNITIDSNSNVYIIGEIMRDLSIGSENLATGQFIAKYDSSGGFKWARSIYGGTMQSKSIRVDRNENCYVLGWFSQYIASGDKEMEGKKFEQNVFVIKYDKAGNTVLIKSVLSGTSYLRPNDMVIDESGNRMYITGAADTLASYSGNASEIFVAKCNLLTCELINKITIGYTNEGGLAYMNDGYSIISDISYIYLAGTLKVSSGGCNIYVAKLDTGLNIIWEKQFTADYGTNIGFDIITDKKNNFYITGQFSSSVSFNKDIIVPKDWADLFIAKLSDEGDVLWVKSAGADIEGGYGEDVGYSLAFKNNENIYLSGYVGRNADFKNNISTINGGPFIAKYNKNGDILQAKSYYSGYDISYQGSTGNIVFDKQGNLYFTTSYYDTLLAEADTISPAIPRNLTATAMSTKSIKIKWSHSTDNIAVSGYYVYRNTEYLTKESYPFNLYKDTFLLEGTKYTYRVRAYDIFGNVSELSDSASAVTFTNTDVIPFNEMGSFNKQRFKLYPVFPDPFINTAIIKYELFKQCKVEISLYNILGIEIKNIYYGSQPTGEYTVEVEGSDLPPGVYYLLIKIESDKIIKRCIKLK